MNLLYLSDTEIVNLHTVTFNEKRESSLMALLLKYLHALI